MSDFVLTITAKKYRNSQQIFQPKRVRKNQNAALKNDVQVKLIDDPQFVDPDNPICTAGMCDFGFSTLQVFQQVGPQ